MPAVLGIDAAWTAGEPSGVALVNAPTVAGPWFCRALAPSYGTFFGLAEGRPVDWGARSMPGEIPDAAQFLSAAFTLVGGARVDLVAIDMPVATVKITGRRKADTDVSKTFGNQWCAVHSPNRTRPGPLGSRFTEEFASHGYPVATTKGPGPAGRQLLEVYPHAAIVRMLGLERRLEYKVSRSSRYWPRTSVEVRIGRLRKAFARLRQGLGTRIEGIELSLPVPPEARTLSDLKRYEDALDALVSAWVGICHLRGQAEPYGDETAAIWIPGR